MSKLYHCGRCQGIYKRECDLKKHINMQDVPCDFYCMDCSMHYKNRYAYLQVHPKNEKPKCVIKTYTQDEINKLTTKDNLVQKVTNTNSPGSVITCINGDHNNVVTPILNMSFDNINREILDREGMVPHGYDINNTMLTHHAVELDKLLLNYVEGQSLLSIQYSKYSMNELLMGLLQLFYSNARTPQYINIIDDNPKNRHNQIHSGEEFVKDYATKTLRNRMIIQVLLQDLDLFCSSSVTNEKVSKFYNEIFRPFVISSYIGNKHSDAMQLIWQNNKTLIDTKVDLKKVKPFHTIIDDSFRDNELQRYQQLDGLLYQGASEIIQSKYNNKYINSERELDEVKLNRSKRPPQLNLIGPTANK